ncbi:hypothetical protein BS17DRAFT_774147 [Gyrodon lividus]|nr:hypothetical protein BS17DRAFT_774147 [Gyrodon lividus]
MSIEHDEPVLTVPWVPDRTEVWRDILRPAMISQVLAAQASPIFDDKCLMIGGRGFGKVTVVAHVTGVEIESASSIYILEDGTGRIRATKALSSVTHRLSQKTENEERAQSLTLEHTYVEATGAPMRLGSGTGLNLDSIRLVGSYHQVMCHILHVIWTNVLIERHILPYTIDGESMPEESMVTCSDSALPPQRIPPTPPEDEGTSIDDRIMSSPPSTPIPAKIVKGKERALPHEVPEFPFREKYSFPATFLLESLPKEIEIETVPRIAECASTVANAQIIPDTKDSRNPCTVINPAPTPVLDRTTRVMPPNSDTVFPNVFTPRKRARYAALHPLARAVIEYMHCAQRSSGGTDLRISITEMGQAVRTRYGYTEEQFDLTIQELLSEAYITSSLDDGFVIITPRF